MNHIQCHSLTAKDFPDHQQRVVATSSGSHYHVISTTSKYGRYFVIPCVEFPEGKYFNTIKELRNTLITR